MQNVNFTPTHRPYAPQDLLQILLKSNYKQIQCQSQSQKLTHQKQLFTNIIITYHEQLIRNKQIIRQIQHMLQIRARLRLQLQKLQQERRRYDLDFINDINQIRLMPILPTQMIIIEKQLNQLRDQNCKMRVRFDSLVDYCQQLENRIKIFEEQNMIRTSVIEKQINSLKSTHIMNKINIENNNVYSMGNNDDLTWRQKVNAVKLENQLYSVELRQKNKVITDKNKRNIQNYSSTKQILRQAQISYKMLTEKQNKLKYRF